MKEKFCSLGEDYSKILEFSKTGKDKTRKMNSLTRISVIVCTRDRPEDLSELLQTLLNQIYPPFEVIVVDDSISSSVKEVVNSFQQRFNNCELRYIEGCGDGLPAARNLGVKVSKGDAILFLDDDTLLQNNVLHAFASFLSAHQKAIGVQGQRFTSLTEYSNNLKRKIANAIYKAFMLSYHKQNKLAVRRSGASIFPYSYPLTAKIETERLDGWCMCYRRQLFDELSFDMNLKRWGYMEDLDFSYRAHKKHPETLYATPYAVIAHKKTNRSRRSSRTHICMTTVYWLYVFFKDIFESSILNLIALLWALTGKLVATVGGAIANRKPKHQLWEIRYLVDSYFYAFRHLRDIKRGNLDFFNKQLKE